MRQPSRQPGRLMCPAASREHGRGFCGAIERSVPPCRLRDAAAHASPSRRGHAVQCGGVAGRRQAPILCDLRCRALPLNAWLYCAKVWRRPTPLPAGTRCSARTSDGQAHVTVERGSSDERAGPFQRTLALWRDLAPVRCVACSCRPVRLACPVHNGARSSRIPGPGQAHCVGSGCLGPLLWLVLGLPSILLSRTDSPQPGPTPSLLRQDATLSITWPALGTTIGPVQASHELKAKVAALALPRALKRFHRMDQHAGMGPIPFPLFPLAPHVCSKANRTLSHGGLRTTFVTARRASCAVVLIKDRDHAGGATRRTGVQSYLD